MSAASKEFIVSARKFAAQFKGFLSLADELEGVESTEQLVHETEARLAALKEQEAEARQTIEAKHVEADEQIAARHREADLQIAAKHQNAARVVDAAREAAATIISDAQTLAAGEATKADASSAKIVERSAHLSKLEEMIAMRQAEHGALEARIVQAEARHASVLSSYREFKAKLPG